LGSNTTAMTSNIKLMLPKEPRPKVNCFDSILVLNSADVTMDIMKSIIDIDFHKLS
jgi:hypothetical protein